MSIPNNITKQNLIDAAERIIKEGIPNNGHSSTYDVFYKEKLLPPKLVVSYANIFANGRELYRNSFEGGIGTECFNLLEEQGFTIIKKNGYYSELAMFLAQAKTSNMKYAHYKNEYLGLKVRASFGKGNIARIPWISFLGKNQKTDKGIYPVYLLYKTVNKLILAYGVSETNTSAINWSFVNNPETIKEYFIRENIGIPERYGASFVYKVYDLEDMPSSIELDNDLFYIISEYITLLKGAAVNEKPSVNPVSKQELFRIDKYIEAVKNSRLKYSSHLQKRFVSSLLTKPFVILSGLSGSGKTKLAQAFAQWICQDESQYCIVPVGADWTNREPLLGYPNALKQDDYIKPDNGALDVIIEANKHPELPYFLVLDEMNLSHVERYFADFLSVMESKDEISLFAEGAINNGVPAKLSLPQNLFIIGTVNIDETTYMFSPKVLDRANAIEFRVTKNEIENFFQSQKEVDMDKLKTKGAAMAQSFLKMAERREFEEQDLSETYKTLVSFFEQLKKTGAEFGYRSATEIIRLINQLTIIDSELSANEKLDIAIMQKLLPKLHGSRRKLCPVLIILGGFCVDKTKLENIEKDVFLKEDFDFESDGIIYPISLEKISRMYNGAIENGFASYAGSVIMEAKAFVNINLNHIEEGLQLTIDAKVEDTLFVLSDALENGEAEHQLVEGFSYDYELNKEDYSLGQNKKIIQPHSRKKHLGIISPNIYVGTLSLPILKDNKEVGNGYVEVRSVKADYRDDYRDMLELITEKCTDLLMQSNSPVSHNFETDFNKDNETLYQKFAFIKSIVSSDEFSEAIHRIVSSPVTQWKETTEQKDIRNTRRFKNSNIKELITGSNRTSLPENHFLGQYGLQSLPTKITSVRKSDTADTPENRFVKFALESFLKFCSAINKKAKEESKLQQESALLEQELESFLNHSIFKEISRPETLRLNSPILQRKEGYREVLRVWLMFDLAAKLVWKGGDDVYKSGKKDIATLYEYWLFFKLLDLFQSIFEIEPKAVSELIKETPDGLNLQLKQGTYTALKGVYNTGSRTLNIRFNYNRSFSGQQDYPHSGSWTTTMRPDYTLSFWPNGILEKEAEVQELIVHIHFDAKYKVANLTDLIKAEKQEELELEKENNRKGIYKNADLLKMHAYKDAIRRTGGAYVLYPGDESVTKKGFHEIVPGLGAFPVRPAKSDDGIHDLKNFILEVIEHFINRASQREKLSYHVYDIHKSDSNNIVKEPLPELIGENRGLIPDETFVLVGFYEKDKWDWITTKGLYNARADSTRGSLRLGPKEAGAKYLLLHSRGKTTTSNILKIVETGPRVFSKQTLIKKGYPTEPSQDYYLVYKVKEVSDNELVGVKWDITKLESFKSGRGSGLPFAVSLTELMKVKV